VLFPTEVFPVGALEVPDLKAFEKSSKFPLVGASYLV
jgi:hypothetical protein